MLDGRSSYITHLLTPRVSYCVCDNDVVCVNTGLWRTEEEQLGRQVSLSFSLSCKICFALLLAHNYMYTTSKTSEQRMQGCHASIVDLFCSPVSVAVQHNDDDNTRLLFKGWRGGWHLLRQINEHV